MFSKRLKGVSVKSTYELVRKKLADVGLSESSRRHF